jgi:hypothetical protein
MFSFLGYQELGPVNFSDWDLIMKFWMIYVNYTDVW